MKSYFVYILKCSDGSYYTGMTNNLESRVKEHSMGLIKKSYTHNRRPVKCVYSEQFSDVWEAIAAEKQIKGWSRKKKKALIRGDIKTLKELSQRYTKQ